eukprot:11895513-Ditylum_brightwellii.AAC.1
MYNAESHKYLNNNQWEGHKHRSAISVPMLKTFTLEIFHLMQANAAFTDCDAQACYDRIIAIITDMPLLVCQFFIKALKQMQYHMLTAYVTSSETNCHSPTSPVHGSGQGSTSLSAEWTFNEQDTDMIIGDATMQHNARQYNLDAQALMNICQQDITLWDELLWVNGGLLETHKPVTP